MAGKLARSRDFEHFLDYWLKSCHDACRILLAAEHQDQTLDQLDSARAGLGDLGQADTSRVLWGPGHSRPGVHCQRWRFRMLLKSCAIPPASVPESLHFLRLAQLGLEFLLIRLGLFLRCDIFHHSDGILRA